MHRRVVLLSVLAATFGSAMGAAATAGAAEPLCQARPFMCVDPLDSIGEYGAYTGHDEPSALFMSKRSGTGGRDLVYTLKLPKNPPKPPRQDGMGPTWDFQLRATFWLGLTMCDTESAPEFTKTCRPNSDFNARFRSLDPKSPFYLGKSPGNAFMELQFYEPGWVPQFDGFGCTATQWCANLTIDSLSSNQNTDVDNNAACDDLTLGGVEPVNWAFVTRSGRPQAPANPIATNNNPAALNPDPNQVLLMNSGDTIRVWMHDTRAGYRIDIFDLTTHRHGSMTASVANGFGHLLYEPNSTTCHEAPYAFHPMYDTATDRGTTWGAHTYNVAFSDEIGHFEYCDAVNANGGDCTDPGANDSVLDADDHACLDGSLYPGAAAIIGCVLDDGDFDGTSYLRDWPGSLPFHYGHNHGQRQRVPTPVQFTTPRSYGRPLERLAFETDLPRIERGDEPAKKPPLCDPLTGANCVNPPHGAEFYPLYTWARTERGCMFQQGGPNLPRTIETFGGTSTTEYGDLLRVDYPGPGFQPIFRINDFHRDIGRNRCIGR